MNDPRPQFGNRFLTDRSEVFDHNAWDNVEWDEEQMKDAERKVLENSEVCLSASEISDLEANASVKWDSFYSVHQNRFFKDRHWLFTEFGELNSTACDFNGTTEPNSCLDTKQLRKNESYPGENSQFKVLEVGCGAGNTIFPLLEKNPDPHLFVYGCDFSHSAIQIVKDCPNYTTDRCFAFVCDVTDDHCDAWPFPANSLDVVVCIFILSALRLSQAEVALRRLASYLKPEGTLLFRDYGRYDLAQLRFKKGRCLAQNLYARGDGTMCYFFTQEEVRAMMMRAGLVETQNIVDRRLQVNRGKKLTMHRVWIQAKYTKPTVNDV